MLEIITNENELKEYIDKYKKEKSLFIHFIPYSYEYHPSLSKLFAVFIETYEGHDPIFIMIDHNKTRGGVSHELLIYYLERTFNLLFKY